MAPTPRTRFRVGDIQDGYRTYLGTVYPTSRNNYEERMDDVVGDFGGSHLLRHEKYERSGSVFTRPAGTGSDWNLPLGITFGSRLGGLKTNNTYRNQILARNAPGAPSMYLPVAILELRDLPRMIRHAGDLLHKIARPSGLNPAREAASATLAYQFGWAPLMQDIGKMLGVADAVRKQQRLLRGAHSANGIRTKVFLDKLDSGSKRGDQILSSTYGTVLSQSWIGIQRCEVWGTCRWVTRDPHLYGREPTWKEAFDAAYGLNASHIPINVWKALPWSWCIDWFAGISDLMQATSNMVFYKPSKVHLMRRWTNEYWWIAKPNYKGGEISSGHSKATWQWRDPLNPTVGPVFTLPFMDGFKLSILGSFAVLGATRNR